MDVNYIIENKLHIAHPRGRYRIVEWAIKPNGDMPAKDFADGLKDSEIRRLYYLFGLISDSTGVIPEKFKKLVNSEDVWEIKAQGSQLRFLAMQASGGRVIVTHGFRKKTDKVSKEDMKKAREATKAHLSLVRGTP